MQDLIDLEQQGWRALSTEGSAGSNFYADLLRADAVMLFPGGLRITGRDQILASLGNQPWQSFRIEDPQVLRLSDDAATVVYKVTAQRQGSPAYMALVSSTYVRDEASWQLALHQHTPA
jgi:hypothetical protein